MSKRFITFISLDGLKLTEATSYTKQNAPLILKRAYIKRVSISDFNPETTPKESPVYIREYELDQFVSSSFELFYVEKWLHQ